MHAYNPSRPIVASAAPNHQPNGLPLIKAQSHFDGKPYLQRVQSLENSFPPLRSFLRFIGDEKDGERKIVEAYYRTTHKRGPARCYCLMFEEMGVSLVKEDGFESAQSLREYLEENPAVESRARNCRRLFILEDMDADYVDALGHHLGVDPLTFSEQTNTWNFTDSVSIPHRGLMSMTEPEKTFTLRYYELRTLLDPKSVDKVSLQMTFSVIKRRYERWKDVNVPSAGKPDRRHAFVRRCASFWTSQDPGEAENGALGWDAVILVDPAFVATSRAPKASKADAMPATRPHASQPSKSATEPLSGIGDNKAQASPYQTWPGQQSTQSQAKTGNVATSFLRQRFTHEKTAGSDIVALGASFTDGLEECLILKNPRNYRNRASLWKAQDLGASQELQATPHRSWPYHHGVSTLTPLTFSQVGVGAQEAELEKLQTIRNIVSPLDEMVFYWTQIATPELIKSTRQRSSNAAYYLLKHVAQHWINHLELVSTTIAKGEWFADDYQAQIDDALSLQQWKADLTRINEIAQDINYMRRHLNHFASAIVLNLERVGVQPGAEGIDASQSLALQGAQKDFLAIYARIQPLRDRAEALGSVPSDLANLRAAFRGVHDSEFSLRLSLFASIVFPLTLIAGIFSMGDQFRPGGPQFWQLWAIGPPCCIILALLLIYGRRPWRVFWDLYEFAVIWLKFYEFIGSEDARASHEREKREQQAKTLKNAQGQTKDEESRGNEG